MSASQIKLILFTLLAARAVAGANTIEEVCQPMSDKFTFYGEQTAYDYSLENNFKRGWLLGQGSFGVVRSVEFGLKSIAKVAVKEVKNDPQALPEINTLVSFSEKGIGSKFYGCQFNEKKILIAEEELFSDMAKEAKLLLFRQAPNSKFVARIKDLVDSLVIMEGYNLIHSDIKEDNVMTDEAFTKFTLIDFGLAQQLNEKLLPQGSPVYMSPGKWAQPTGLASVTEDLYAIGIMSGVLNNDNGFSAVYRDYSKKPEGEDLPFGCFRQFLSDYCQQALKNNAVRFLSRANFGNFHKGKGRRQFETVNFTTLMAMMVEYFDYPFTLKQTSEILARHIREFETLEAMDPVSYRPQPRDKSYGRSDQPDIFDFGRKYPRVHTDDLANYKLKFELAKTLELKILKDKEFELTARLALLKAKNEKEKVKQEVESELNKSVVLPKVAIDQKLKHSTVVVDLKKQTYESAKKQFLESSKYQREYHQKTNIQDDVVKMMVGEMSAPKIDKSMKNKGKIAASKPPLKAEVQKTAVKDLAKDNKIPAEQLVLPPHLSDLPDIVDLTKVRPEERKPLTGFAKILAKASEKKQMDMLRYIYRPYLFNPIFGIDVGTVFSSHENFKKFLEQNAKLAQDLASKPEPRNKFAGLGLTIDGKVSATQDIEAATKMLHQINKNVGKGIGPSAMLGGSLYRDSFDDSIIPGAGEWSAIRQDFLYRMVI